MVFNILQTKAPPNRRGFHFSIPCHGHIPKAFGGGLMLYETLFRRSIVILQFETYEGRLWI